MIGFNICLVHTFLSTNRALHRVRHVLICIHLIAFLCSDPILLSTQHPLTLMLLVSFKYSVLCFACVPKFANFFSQVFFEYRLSTLIISTKFCVHSYNLRICCLTFNELLKIFHFHFFSWLKSRMSKNESIWALMCAHVLFFFFCNYFHATIIIKFTVMVGFECFLEIIQCINVVPKLVISNSMHSVCMCQHAQFRGAINLNLSSE